MIDTPFERVYESTVCLSAVPSALAASYLTKADSSLSQRDGSARPCFLTKLLDDCTVDGKLSELDKTNIKGAAIIVYAGELSV